MNTASHANRRDAGAWMWVFLWVSIIYITIPLARTIQEYVRDHGTPWLFFWFTMSAIAIGAVWAFSLLWKKRKGLSPWRLLLLTLVVGLFLWLTWVLRRNPEEAIHFVQYGVLTLLIYRAYRKQILGPSLYFASAMLGCMFGILDELIQWITPRRYFDFRDIGINTLAVLLVMMAIVTVQGRAATSIRFYQGLRTGFFWMAVNILLLMFCLMNTAAMKEWYTRFIPAAQKIPYVTAEYGYLYTDPDIGSFKSRLHPRQLAKEEKEKAAELAPRLREVRTDEQYHAFIQQTPPHKYPLLVEARVRLFRRDRYATTARHTGNETERQRTAVIAYRENQILERYMPTILEASGYKWRDDIRAYFEPFMANAPPYTSPVSYYLITGFSKLFMFTLLAVLLVSALAGQRWAARKSHEQE